MSLAIGIGGGFSPVVVHLSGEHSSSFMKGARYLFVLAIFVVLGALVLRRCFFSVNPNKAWTNPGRGEIPPLGQDSPENSGVTKPGQRSMSYVEGQPFTVNGKTYQNKQEYMEELYLTDNVFRSFANRKEYTGDSSVCIAKFRNNSNISNTNWLVYGTDNKVTVIRESMDGVPIVLGVKYADTMYEGPKLTAEEVYAFIDAKGLAIN